MGSVLGEGLQGLEWDRELRLMPGPGDGLLHAARVHCFRGGHGGEGLARHTPWRPELLNGLWWPLYGGSLGPWDRAQGPGLLPLGGQVQELALAKDSARLAAGLLGHLGPFPGTRAFRGLPGVLRYSWAILLMQTICFSRGSKEEE